MAEMANNFGKESRKAVMCAVDVHFFSESAVLVQL